MPSSRIARRAAPLVVLLLAGCDAASNPVVDLAAEEAALIEASDALVAAEMARDTEGALAHYAGDAVAQPANMPAVQGTDALRALYAEFFALPFEFSATREGTRLAADASMAWEWGANHFTAEDGTVMHGKYIGVWEKVDGAWKVKAVAFSEDAPVQRPVNAPQ